LGSQAAGHQHTIIAIIVIAVGHGPVRILGVLFLVIIVIAMIVWVATRQQKSYYALIIETAGSPGTALVSTDRSVVSGLVVQIMDAISNPQAEFRV
jgi:Family of unknown function (DUF6232)